MERIMRNLCPGVYYIKVDDEENDDNVKSFLTRYMAVLLQNATNFK